MKLLAVILLGLIYATSAQTPCFARTTATARPNSAWTDGYTQYQVYDISVVNEGICPLLRVVSFFSAGPGFIKESWNYDATSGLIIGYGDALQVGQTFTGAGFVLANSSSPALAFDRPGCDDACVSASTPTSAPTTPTPTTTAAPTTASCGGAQCASNQLCLTTTEGPTCVYRLCQDIVCAGLNQVCINNGGYARCITTGGPTSTTPAPTTPTPATSTAAPTTQPQTCTISTSVVRDDNSWMDAEGRNNTLYRFVLTNNGPCPLSAHVTSFVFGAGVVVSTWNLESTLGGYKVLGFGATLAAGATYNGAGFILANAPERVYATGYGTVCNC